MSKSILLLGATGLVGRECLERLADDPAFTDVVVVARRGADRSLPAKVRWLVTDFERLEALGDELAVDQVLCALGTTIKQASSQERFRRVDHDYPLVVARLARERGAHHFLLVSALGADPASRVFYNRVKGELERDVRALGYRSVTIARPSLLLGGRAERRRGEEVAKLFGVLVPGRWRPIQARDVAAALVRMAREDAPGERVVDSAELRRLARTG